VAMPDAIIYCRPSLMYASHYAVSTQAAEQDTNND